MRATVLEGVGQVRLVDVPDPVIEQPSDALVTIWSASAGTFPPDGWEGP
jgi:threonine dehydrogenase-like Zn-dependent dehydrogenase